MKQAIKTSTRTNQEVVMDTIDVRGLPEDEANLIQKLVDLLREKESLMKPEGYKKKSKFFQMVREIQEQAEGLNSEEVDKAIEEAIESVRKQELKEMTSKI